MNIISVRVEGLFGLFKHQINLRRRERITILHGQNGVGKTTILRMLKALCAFEFHNLSKFHFESFKLTFDSTEQLLVKRVVVESRPLLKFILEETNRDGAPIEESAPIYEFTQLATEAMDEAELRRLIGIPVGNIEDVIAELDQVGPRMWREIPTGETLGLDEVLNKYSDRLPIKDDVLVKRAVPGRLRELLRSNSVYLIETQRLTAQSRAASDRERWQRNVYLHKAAMPLAEVSAVDEISQDLTARIGDALQNSARIAAKLDAQFAYKLLTGPAPSIDENQIRERYSELRAFNNRLGQAGFLDSGYIYDLPTQVLESADKKALALYLKDLEEKLEPYKNLLSKVLLFVSIINGRFRNKRIVVDKDKGLKFEASKQSAPLSASSLSSGEQHELVLMYTLLFRVPPGTLIEIDEPELSLHVTWQQKFLEDLRGLSEAANLHFLVATHSPSIINGRLDLTVELDG